MEDHRLYVFVDLILHVGKNSTSDEIARLRDVMGTIAYDAVRKGKIIYEHTDSVMQKALL